MLRQVWNSHITVSSSEVFVLSPEKCWCKCVNFRIRRWDVCVKLVERFGYYLLGRVPPVPDIEILMETICSAVQLLVELTVVVG